MLFLQHVVFLQDAVTPLDIILLFLQIIHPTTGLGNVDPKFFLARLWAY